VQKTSDAPVVVVLSVVVDVTVGEVVGVQVSGNIMQQKGV
jgi:hypothetical protein